MPNENGLYSDEEMLVIYQQAEVAIVQGNQSYSANGMEFTKADLWRIQQRVRELKAIIAAKASRTVGSIRTTKVIF